MPEIILIGLNHKTAPVELRECLSFTTDQSRDALETLQMQASVKEALIFSTCNRMEIRLYRQTEPPPSRSSGSSRRIRTFRWQTSRSPYTSMKAMMP